MRKRPQAWLASIVLAVLAFVVNPALLSGCKTEFHFTEKEMAGVLTSVNGDNVLSFEHQGKKYQLSLKLEQVAGDDKLEEVSAADTWHATRIAHACGERTFLRSAAACLDTSTMPIKGTATLLAGDAKLLDNVVVTGDLVVIGTELTNGRITLKADEQTIQLKSTDGKSFTVDLVTLGDKLTFSAG